MAIEYSQFEYSSYEYTMYHVYQADTALAWSFGIFFNFLKNKRYRYKNNKKLNKWIDKYRNESAFGLLRLDSNRALIKDIWNENFYDFSPFKNDNKNFLPFIKKFHINETRLRRNNYQTKNIKFKYTCLTEGLIRSNVPVLVDEIDLQYI